jgi:protein-S-isoprenylcysteine O-methyltransferase Ste14
MRERTKISLKAHAVAVYFAFCWFVAIPFLVMRLDRYINLDFPETLVYIGYLIAPFAFGLSYSSLLIFVFRGHGTALPADPPKVFVVRGPYRYVRNPMYIGNLCLILCEAFIFRSPGIFLYFLILSAITHIYVTTREESDLEKRFGPEYLTYKHTVRRWMPSLNWIRREKFAA